MKIILATDGSTYSELAAVLISKIPALAASEIVVASVVNPPVPAMGIVDVFPAAFDGEQVEAIYTAQHEHAKESGAKASSWLGSIPHRTQILEGEAVEQLLKLVEDEKADLIVVGSRGVGGFEAFLLGSVAKELVKRCPSSVLIARTGENHDAKPVIESMLAKTRISAAVGFDGSDGSRIALHAVKELGPGQFDRLYAVCAEPIGVLPAGLDASEFATAYPEEHALVVETAKKGELELDGYADDVVGAHGVGSPAKVLAKVVKEYGLDLIVIGATRHGFLERLLIGSVSNEVAATAPCSVWVVRPSAESR